MYRVIGIDFGTSTTYMNVKRYNGNQPDGDRFSYIPVMFNYGESSGYVATIVRENADGSFDFGEKAAEPLAGSRIYSEIKMRLESDNETERAEAMRITKEFFRFLYATYLQQAANLGSEDDEVETVVSYPVKWQADTSRFMLEAAQEAGFQNVRGMDEAEAAVAAVLCQNSNGKGLIYADKPGYLLLIDMGAGTTDLVVCKYRISDGGLAIELVTSWPQNSDEPTFGGREIDAMLSQYVEGYLSQALAPALHQLAHDMANAPGSAKKWKELTVSKQLSANNPVTTCGYLDGIRSMLSTHFPAFGRAEFEDFAGSGLRDYVRLLEGCLEESCHQDAQFSEVGLDLVILTGGHSAWYFAKEILTGAMAGWLEHPALTRVRENPNRVIGLPNPQTTVSLGLVYSKLPYKLEKPAPQNTPLEKPSLQKTGAEEFTIEAAKTEDSATDEPPKGTPYTTQIHQTHRKTNAADRTQAIVRHIIATAPDLKKTNQAENRSLTECLRKSFGIAADDEILYADDYDNGAGQTGAVLTATGIYMRRAGSFQKFTKEYMTWPLFQNSHREGASLFGTSSIYSYYHNGLASAWFSSEHIMRGMDKLYYTLRGETHAPALAGSASHGRYRWDDSLLPLVEQFIQEDPIITRSTELSHYHNWTENTKKWSLRGNPDVYFIRGIGGEGDSIAAITSNGLEIRLWNFWSDYSGPTILWSEFLNTVLEDRSGTIGKHVWETFQLGESLCSLQQILRETSVASEPDWPV